MLHWIKQTLWGGYTVSCVLNRLALNYTKPIRKIPYLYLNNNKKNICYYKSIEARTHFKILWVCINKKFLWRILQGCQHEDIKT